MFGFLKELYFEWSLLEKKKICLDFEKDANYYSYVCIQGFKVTSIKHLCERKPTVRLQGAQGHFLPLIDFLRLLWSHGLTRL